MKLIIGSTLTKSKVISRTSTCKAAARHARNLLCMVLPTQPGLHSWILVHGRTLVCWHRGEWRLEQCGNTVARLWVRGRYRTRWDCALSCCQIREKYSIPPKMLVAEVAVVAKFVLWMDFAHYNLFILPKHTSIPKVTCLHVSLSVLSEFFLVYTFRTEARKFYTKQ